MDLQAYLNNFHQISTADYQLLIEKFKTKSFVKNEFLCMPGQVQKVLYFVKSGVQMSYFDAANKSHGRKEQP